MMSTSHSVLLEQQQQQHWLLRLPMMTVTTRVVKGGQEGLHDEMAELMYSTRYAVQKLDGKSMCYNKICATVGELSVNISLVKVTRYTAAIQFLIIHSLPTPTTPLSLFRWISPAHAALLLFIYLKLHVGHVTATFKNNALFPIMTWSQISCYHTCCI